MTIPSRWVLVLAASLWLQGCSQVEDTGDLRQYVRETQAQPSGRIEPLPEFEPYESFLYRATSLRGPFQPLVEVAPAEEEDGEAPRNNLKPDFDRPKEPLESFKLESLKMVGTIRMSGADHLSALIRDPNGEIHQVHPDTHLGRDYGKITKISETQVDLVEIVPDGRDGWMKRPRNLVLLEQ